MGLTPDAQEGEWDVKFQELVSRRARARWVREEEKGECKKREEGGEEWG